MTHRTPTAPVVLLTLVVLAGTAFPRSAQAQLPPDLRETRYTGFGFSASIPSVLTGIAVFHNIPSLGLGVFANGRYSLDSPTRESRFEDDLTLVEAFELGDVPVGSRDAFRMGSVGIFRPLDPNMAVFVGLGYTEERSYQEIFDESQQRGEFGHYWLEVEDDLKSGMNYTVGVLIRATRNFVFMGGAETFPGGITVAGLLSFPW